jgi:hypothetical protein
MSLSVDRRKVAMPLADRWIVVSRTLICVVVADIAAARAKLLAVPLTTM